MNNGLKPSSDKPPNPPSKGGQTSFVYLENHPFSKPVFVRNWLKPLFKGFGVETITGLILLYLFQNLTMLPIIKRFGL